MQNERRRKYLWIDIKRSWAIYLLLLFPLVYLIVFNYTPMYGLIIAFKNFKPALGIWGSKWVGLYHFNRFVTQQNFWNTLKNTILISLYSVAAGFPMPILLALLLNNTKSQRLKSAAQTITYLPHFISVVVLVGILNVFFSPDNGVISKVLNSMGLLKGPLKVLLTEGSFIHLYVWSGVWQHMGWDSIIYLAALSSVDPFLHEAAVVDGASKVKRVWYIDLPCIIPTIVTLLILRVGNMLNIGFEKVYLMQNSINVFESEVISTYVYKQGLLNTQYSYSTAIGFANSVVNMILLLTVDRIAKSLGQDGLF